LNVGASDLPVVAVCIPVNQIKERAARTLRGRCEVVTTGYDGIDGLTKDEKAVVVGLLIGSGTRVGAQLLDGFPHLRVVSTWSIGVDHIDLQETRARGIVVANAPNRADALAEIVLALMLSLSRKLPEAMAAVSSNAWSKPPVGTDLRGKRLFIVGFGNTGRAVATAAQAFGMEISFFDARADIAGMRGAKQEGNLESGLRCADWVSLHVDLNPTTFHMMDARSIALMKPTAYLINTSRGAVVDQQGLAAALASGAIAGAGLDVLEREPPDPDDPILRNRNVVVTPHIGFATQEVWEDMIDCAVGNLLACLYGEPCEYVL
jgi:phosphoglycerate dehydrogenase-like enzyme